MGKVPLDGTQGFHLASGAKRASRSEVHMSRAAERRPPRPQAGWAVGGGMFNRLGAWSSMTL